MNTQNSIYMAIETTIASEETLCCLSNHLMQWSNQIWIMNLSPFAQYWKQQASVSDSTVSVLWRNILNRTFGEMPDDSAAALQLQQPYLAAVANHPWKALLLIGAMKQHAFSGMITEWSRAGERLLASCSWEIWEQNIRQLGEIWETAGLKKFRASRLRSQTERFLSIAQRTGIYQIQDSSILNRESIQKRFGREIAAVWNWQFPSDTHHKAYDLPEFPWKPYWFHKPLITRRHTDFPMKHWEQIQPDLQEDFNRLANQIEQKQLTDIHWTIRLEELRELSLTIHFRNPHSLAAEKDHQKTALLQAFYRFQDHPFLKEQDTSGIIYWQLEIKSLFRPPAVFYNIFGELQGEDSGEDGLAGMANQLPVKLERYRIHEDWLPEDSWQSYSPSNNHKERVFSEKSILIPADKRPLYIRTHPKLIESQQGLFLEKVMGKWWRPNGNTERTYYQYTDPSGNRYWVFRDPQGRWFEHGIYG